MLILLFVLKYMYISLLLKMMNGFPDKQISWPVPLIFVVQFLWMIRLKLIVGVLQFTQLTALSYSTVELKRAVASK